MTNDSPVEFYTHQMSELENKLERLYKKRGLIGWMRLVIVLAMIAAVCYSWNVSIAMIILSVLAGSSLFVFAVLRDTDNSESIINLEVLISINKKELQYASGNYHDADNGEDLEPLHHEYAADLDLFGPSSLYQYINRCNAQKAKLLLAKRLLESLSSSEIPEQQEAIRELTKKPLWRQQLQAYGIKQKISVSTEQKVLEWLANEEKDFEHASFKLLLFIFPIITISCLYLSIAGDIRIGIFLLFFIAFIGVSGVLSKKITPVYNLLSKIVSEIGVLYAELHWFENEPFESRLLKELKNKIRGQAAVNASGEIQHLKKILDRFDARLNVLAFFILNTLFLWDLWQVMALKKWKEKNRSMVPDWFELIAALEVTSTFATLSFNHPDWCFPSLASEHFSLKGEQIGHPLIPAKQRVSNSFEVHGTSRIDLVTGSNMAGKSTFLRSIGINMVLAYAGSCVCAKAFTISMAKLISSMRVTDNLAESTSTFYAELKKLKLIIEAVNRQENVFIMLDEILRGTNSLDRHTGSTALIKQFVKKKAVALIATHDLELARLEHEFPDNIGNYHFDVQVARDELYFDYKLKKGICTSLNASILMKNIGIELD